ncbi:MAG TPA: LacI family DNA-binding transcriptional regulator [Clostridia bacterium]|nr:LacI family DNA-binding transcriptional regulator [Clostridia bacterium]
MEAVKIAATIKDVAKYAGVSTATISKYINGVAVKEQNRARIEEAIRALDFRVNTMARGLKTNKTMTIGVLIPSLENIFATSIVSHIERIFLQNGYSTIICDYNQDIGLENSKFDFLMSKFVDGVIIMPHGITEERVRNAIDMDIPVVLIDRPMKNGECDLVLVDNLNASYNAVEQLIVKGHREIGIISGPQDIYTAQERLKGYLRVHEDYGIKVNEDNIKYGDYEIQSGYDQMKEFLNSEKLPDAVFVTNYEMTIGAVMALNESSIKVPEELSLIGFDNQQLARVIKPNLAIVVQPIQQIGESAANIILRRLKGDRTNYPSMLRLKTELLAGQSIQERTTIK